MFSCNYNKDHPEELAKPEINGMVTLLDAFKNTLLRVPNHRFLGTRNETDAEGTRVYSWKTFQEVAAIMEDLARGKQRHDF